MRTMVVLSLVGLIGAAGALAQDAPIRLENPGSAALPPCRIQGRGRRAGPPAT
jgi:hypothetical protein